MQVNEFSCGGVVLDGRKVLLISVKNLKNKKIWTFPKGHIEEGETPRQAAVREVEEETGYRCSVIKSMLQVKYFFTLKEKTIKKTVKWFLMKPNFKAGKFDSCEITGIVWVSLKKARTLLRYQSDLQLIDLTEEFLTSQPDFRKNN